MSNKVEGPFNRQGVEGVEVIELSDYLRQDPAEFAVRAHKLGTEKYERLRKQFVEYMLNTDVGKLADQVCKGELACGNLFELINQIDDFEESELLWKKLAQLAVHLAIRVSDTRSCLRDFLSGKDIAVAQTEKVLRARYNLLADAE